MSKNGILPEHIKKMFYNCIADYKHVHSPSYNKSYWGGTTFYIFQGTKNNNSCISPYYKK